MVMCLGRELIAQFSLQGLVLGLNHITYKGKKGKIDLIYIANLH